ncbi:hypothetical protein AM588_10009056 [Phytophthora nicotianae]|uniref:arabinogalactan endo-beta-1,4-galactanase n=1 Tax=Phytophthora nicotianae TaxID=4792 RepID=A0A0W8D9J3_PHYNI|nr:hypothetical protein AM588_10009056 [Phytophthora nicotianae]
MFLRTAFLFASTCLASALSSSAAALTNGHDLSSVALMETIHGAQWIDTDGNTTTIESIFSEGGMDAVRLRIWTAGEYDLNYTLALAQRFSKAGFKIYLDMHFSDTWADPHHQNIPAAWDNSQRVELYVRVGLFYGSLRQRDRDPDDVDSFGFSFYPFYGVEATIDALNSSLTQVAKDYNKPLYVAETDWPVACENVTLSADYPVSAEGQTQWVTAIKDVLEGLPNGLGSGIFYWEPAYLSVASLGSSCQSALLFDVNWSNWPTTYATALSSVNMFANM